MAAQLGSYGLPLVLALGGLGQGAMAQCAVPSSHLISWWPGDLRAVDIIDGNFGRVVGDLLVEAGQVGEAFSFDGVDDRIRLDDPDNLKLTHSLTIEGWVLVRSFSGRIFHRGDNRPGLDPYYLSVEPSGNVRFHIEALDGVEDLEASLPGQTFVHVAATLDGSTGLMRIYVNGAVSAETTTDVRPFRDLDSGSQPDVAIGNHGGTVVSEPFHGAIDELSIYGRALDEREVQAVFSAGGSGKCQLPAAYLPFGSGCPGTAGTPNLVNLQGMRPWIGESFTLQLSGIPSGGTPVLFFGVEEDPPLDLALMGLPGCQAYIMPMACQPLANEGGVAFFAAVIPNEPMLVGASVYVQCAVPDPGVNAAHGTVSNAGQMLIGMR